MKFERGLYIRANFGEQLMDINVKLSKPVKVRQILIAIHGFAGDCESSVINSLSQELSKDDVLVVAFDLPCHGQDTNNSILNFNLCLDYLKQVEQTVLDQYKGVPISYFATSFGGFLLLNYLKTSTVKYNKIILRSPAIKMDKILKDVLLCEHGYSFSDLQCGAINLGYGRMVDVDINFYNSLVENSLDNYQNNNFLYIIQGKKDDVVNYLDNEDFFNKKCKDNYKIYYFDNADHRYKNNGEKEKIVEITKQILLN